VCGLPLVPVRGQPEHRLAGSYVNFYIANRSVVVPLLDAKRDRAALAVLKRAFPKRKIVGVPAREILLGGGNIHCITSKCPARPSPCGSFVTGCNRLITANQLTLRPARRYHLRPRPKTVRSACR